MPPHAQNTERQREAFTRLSHDKNPLHCDPLHAHRTPYGRVVLHGMAAVLSALGAWANGRSFELLTMKGRFARPVYVGEEYDFTASERGDEVTLALVKGRAVRAEVKFTWRPLERAGQPPAAPFHPLREAALFTESSPHHFEHFAYEAGPWEDAAPFGLSPGQLPRHQLDALAGASYLVGMVVPGRQALFSDFSFEFEPAPEVPFEFKDVNVEWDARFSQYRVTGNGIGIRGMALSAFRRPEPTEYGVDDIREGLRLEGRPFAGQTALVTGASRGFGAVLAQGLALGGAEVLLHYRTCEAQARKVAHAIRAEGGKAELFRADLSRAADCAALFEAVKARGPLLDLVMHGAAGPAEAEAFFDQTPEELVAFVSRTLELNVRVARALLPALKPDGRWVTISTAFTRAPEPRFAHYVSAKAAVEGLFHALAAEPRGPNVVVARPPRMLTDQTNLPFQRAAPASPIPVARALLEALIAEPSPSRFREIDL